MNSLRQVVDVRPAGEAELLTVAHSVESTDLPFRGGVREWRLLAVRSRGGCRVWLSGVDRHGSDVLEPVSVVDALKGIVLTGTGGYVLEGWPVTAFDAAAMRRRIVERAEAELAERA